MRAYILVIACFHFAFVSFAEEPAKTPAPTPPPAATTQTPLVVAPTKPAPQFTLPKPPSPEWIALLDRLKIQPRAGDINNGAVSASLIDIFSDNAELKAKSTSLSSEYEKALLERATKWESELKELRTQYETKMIAELPEAKRESAQKFMELSRSKWGEASERDAKTRAEFLEKMRHGTRPPTNGTKTPVAGSQTVAPSRTPTQPNADANAWMRDERMKAMKQDEESVRALRELLGQDDAARLDRFNRSHPLVAQPGIKPTAPPINATTPPAAPPLTAPEAKKSATP